MIADPINIPATAVRIVEAVLNAAETSGGQVLTWDNPDEFDGLDPVFVEALRRRVEDILLDAAKEARHG